MPGYGHVVLRLDKLGSSENSDLIMIDFLSQ